MITLTGNTNRRCFINPDYIVWMEENPDVKGETVIMLRVGGPRIVMQSPSQILRAIDNHTDRLSRQDENMRLDERAHRG